MSNLLSSDPEAVSPYAAVGAGIGGVVLGLIVGLAGAYLLNRRSDRRPNKLFSQEGFNGNHSYHELSTGSCPGVLGSPYKVEPWLPPSGTPNSVVSPPQEHMPLRNSHISTLGVATPNTSPGQSTIPRMPRATVTPDTSPDLSDRNHQVYVVHHDGGRAPVTVYTADGTEVVELPPSYDGQTRTQRRGGGEGSSGNAPPLQPQRRAPGEIRKTRLGNLSSTN